MPFRRGAQAGVQVIREVLERLRAGHGHQANKV
jgi:hypothetical protein